METTGGDPIADVIAHGKSRIGADLSEWQGRLERFLNARDFATGSAVVTDLRLPPASGGASSGTVIFTASDTDSDRRERIVLRFHPGDNSHAHEYDMLTQFKLLDALGRTDVASPRVFGVDDTGEYFGVPGFLMGYMDGTPLPTTYPTNGPLVDATPEGRTTMVRDVLSALATIHQVDWEAIDVEPLTRSGNGNSALERDVDWYRTAMRWGAPELEDTVEPVLDWLLGNQFTPAVLALCHGDTSLPNYMFRDGRLAGVLDWEFAFIGAPELDLGYQNVAHEILMLGHDALDGVPDAAARLALYEEVSGRTLSDWDYYFTFACAKLLIHMGLTFRGAGPEMQDARNSFVTLTTDMMQEAWTSARR